MTWFIVIMGEIILIGVVIVLLSAELPPSLHSVVKSHQLPEPLDNPTDSSDNKSIDDEDWE